MTPFELEAKSYSKVIGLFAETRWLQIHTKKMKDPDRVIRRRAGDDWF